LYYYRAYGLTIASELPVPEFCTIEPVAEAQVQIVTGEFSLPRKSLRFKPRKIIALNGGILLYWRRIGAFLVQEGTRITVMPFPGSFDTGYINAILIGAAMGTVLLQRGDLTVFHSAVLGKRDRQGAVAFMALSGGGKSTMATGMLRSGYSLVCDDMLVLGKGDPPLSVQPGFPGMKLWPESADNIVDDADSLPMIGEKGKYEKRSLAMHDNFIDNPLPLNSLFLLDYGKVAKPAASRLSEREALSLLMPHWYGSLFGGDLLPILGKDRLFDECSRLARNIPVYTLIRPPGMDRLDETVALVDRIRRETAKDNDIEKE